MASGTFVVPFEKELMKSSAFGMKYPIPMPIAMAKKIQSVRYLSRKPSFFRSAAGAQLFADMSE
jgi:hypothetical protein